MPFSPHAFPRWRSKAIEARSSRELRSLVQDEASTVDASDASQASHRRHAARCGRAPSSSRIATMQSSSPNSRQIRAGREEVASTRNRCLPRLSQERLIQIKVFCARRAQCRSPAEAPPWCPRGAGGGRAPPPAFLLLGPLALAALAAAPIATPAASDHTPRHRSRRHAWGTTRVAVLCPSARPRRRRGTAGSLRVTSISPWIDADGCFRPIDHLARRNRVAPRADRCEVWGTGT